MDIGIEAVASLEEYVGTYLEMTLKIKRVKSTNASVFCDGEDNQRTRMWRIYITTNSGKTLPSRITATFKKKSFGAQKVRSRDAISKISKSCP